MWLDVWYISGTIYPHDSQEVEADQSIISSVGTGRARLLGFRVRFAGQNPSLGTLRLSGFGPFRASGFSRLFQAFLDHIQHDISLFIS